MLLRTEAKQQWNRFLIVCGLKCVIFFFNFCCVSGGKRSPTLSQSSPPRPVRSHSPVSLWSIWSIIVKMATGSGWQQYYCPAGQGKFCSSSASSMSFQSGITMEYTQDLHLKMSKKIAQLTKVRSISLRPVLYFPERYLNLCFRPRTSRCCERTAHQYPSVFPIW